MDSVHGGGVGVGGSRFFRIRIRLRNNPRNKTKFGLFQSKYTLSKENMTFYIIKKEEYHFILPSQYKYDFLDGYPRGSAGINMFSISNMSEFVPRGVGGGFYKQPTAYPSKKSYLY